MDRSLLAEMTLPARTSPYGSTRALLAEICKFVGDYILLPEKFASLVSRFVLAGWVLEATQTAPALTITGPDTLKGIQLLDLLHCLCRHPVRLTGVTPARLCSLPNALGCTLLISQSTISAKLQRLLDDIGRRDQKVLHRGGLLDLYGCQVIHAESGWDNGPCSFRSVEIPMLPTDQRLPVFDVSIQHRIASDFQPKLLDFRRANIGKARGARFDASSFSQPLRALVQSLAAATPDDVDLQAEFSNLLREEDAEARSARWIDLSTVAIEAVLVACGEESRAVYVGDLARIAEEIWKRRGRETGLDPGAFGKRLKLLGFTTEPRDANGVKFVLTESVRSRAHQLARDFGVPEVESEEQWKGAAPGKET
jgi:hypothetical protein